MNAFDFLLSYSKDLEKEFVLGHGEGVTFKEIYQDSLKIADFLYYIVGQNQNILLISPNSSSFIKSYLGILKSGNICIPVNPAIEQKNLDYIADTTHCNLIFSLGKNGLDFNTQGSYIINDIKLGNILRSNSSPIDIFDKTFDENRTAEIIFTSGSTGLPKGVMLSHRNICSNTQSILEYLNLTTADIVGVVLPFYYCYGLSLLHTHLKAGGSIVLSNNFMFLGSVINDLLKYRCTGFAGVPSHFQILLRKSATFSTTNFPDLRYVTQAGGKLHTVFIEEFRKAFPEIDFFVMYGQTEATARLSFLPPEYLSVKPGSIGRAIPGVTLQIMDEAMQPLECGDVGELAARGPNVMKGYFDDFISTSETLRDGWLLTGDLARMDDDGFIFLEGRKKEIIKVGGRRVSPKEIEEVILLMEEVIDCTIEGVYDDILGEGIKARIVLKQECEKAVMQEKILKMCSSRLSSYKVPQLICFENAINMNASGKKVKNIIV